jgi:hypothetical protein
MATQARMGHAGVLRARDARAHRRAALTFHASMLALLVLVPLLVLLAIWWIEARSPLA